MFAGSPIKRIGRAKMIRNALVAAGNSGDPGLVEAIVGLLGDDSPVVRGAAIWALRRLDSACWGSERGRRLADESDQSVLGEWGAAAVDLVVPLVDPPAGE